MIRPANIRMQAISFSKGCRGGKKLRGELIKTKTVKEIKLLMENFYKNLE